jgi:hypothetical protein
MRKFYSKMGGTCSTYRKGEKCLKIRIGRQQKLSVQKLNLNYTGWESALDSSSSGLRTVASFFEKRDPSGFWKCDFVRSWDNTSFWRKPLLMTLACFGKGISNLYFWQRPFNLCIIKISYSWSTVSRNAESILLYLDWQRVGPRGCVYTKCFQLHCCCGQII